MKNNYLKKAGAVALAAVMAVTFAPVASLNVFAKNIGVEASLGDKKNVITASATTIDEDGSYVISGGATNITITVSGSATKVSIDLNGTDGNTIKCGAAIGNKATINITGGWTTMSTETGYVVPSVNVSSLETPAAVKISGNLIVKDTDGSLNDRLGKTFDKTPVARTENSTTHNNVNYFVGADTINTAAAYKNNNKAFGNKYNDIYAVNGSVEVKGLVSGHVARIAENATAGTTVSATAADKTSLVKATTRYTYKFTSTDINNVGTGTYTDVAYSAGKDGLTTLFGNTEAPTKDDTYLKTNTLSVSNATKKGIQSYDRAIELTESTDDKFAKGLELPYVDAHTFDPQTNEGSTGITYFTKDPSAYVNDFDGVAVIDGSKYVIDTANADKTKEEQLEAASHSAKASIKVVKGTTVSGNVVDDWNEVHPGTGVTVSGPKTSTIVVGHLETVGTKYSTWDHIGYIYGANHVEGINNTINFFKESAYLSNEYVSSQIDVPQVADGTFATVNQAFADTKVNLGDGVTYFYEQKTNQIGENHANFVFGSAKIASKALGCVLSGDLLDGTNYFSKATPGETVYAAKGIKATYKNVAPMVNVKGEISEEGTKQSNGYYTWTVNQGTAATGASAIPAYRMYRKSGEHVYTINPDEVAMLVNAGWINEGEAFKVNSVTSEVGVPVYRVYNRNNGGMHFYTANAAEKDMLLANGWTEGKVVFYGAEKANGIAVYRTYNTGSNNGEHNYTTNIKEADMNVQAGWRAEGVAFYAFK